MTNPVANLRKLMNRMGLPHPPISCFPSLITILITIIIFHFSFFIFQSTAQPPQGFSYQAIITDALDQPLANTTVGVQVTLLEGGVAGRPVYVETHTPTTDPIGHVSLVVGNGTVVSGDFASVVWSAGEYWVQVETDPEGGTNYTISGTSQLLSVPFAMVAHNALSGGEPGPPGADGADGLIPDGTAIGNTTFWDGIQWVVDNNNLFHDGQRVGIGTDEPAAQLHLQGTGTGEGNVVFVGNYKASNPGAPPVEGAGTRMMWHPDKAAFRAGRITNTQWNNSSLGTFSIAAGSDVIASGSGSVALGSDNIASGDYSIALNYLTNASGYASTAMGLLSIASGQASFAMGYSVRAPSFVETAIGIFNTLYTPEDPFLIGANDRLFVIGNGTSEDTRSDALVLLKNGNLSLGNSNPQYRLSIVDNGLGLDRPAANTLAFYTNSEERMRISNAGRVSINTTGSSDILNVRSEAGEPAFRITVSNTTRFRVYGTGGVGVGSNMINNQPPGGTLAVSGRVAINVADNDAGSFHLVVNGTAANPTASWSTFSDERLKHSIVPMQNGSLDRLLSLQGYNFEFRDEAIENRPVLPGTQSGFIAQQVQEVFPDWVDADAEGYLFVTEKGLTAIIVEALRELKEEKDIEIKNLRNRLDKMEALLDGLIQSGSVTIQSRVEGTFEK